MPTPQSPVTALVERPRSRAFTASGCVDHWPLLLTWTVIESIPSGPRGVV
jgi:hypothetical protein